MKGEQINYVPSVGAWVLFLSLILFCMPLMISASTIGFCFTSFYRFRHYCCSIYNQLQYEYFLRSQRAVIGQTARARRNLRRSKQRVQNSLDELTLPVWPVHIPNLVGL